MDLIMNSISPHDVKHTPGNLIGIHLTIGISTPIPAKFVVFCQYLGEILTLGSFVAALIQY